ncbi:MAG TPA: peptidoglycan DD-metalloendopeptidase family protein [Crocinitomicaceae bacterium]|nr:peptidoglycan DD-metalloendopeptidase family protein [Crocinitomicaceae bacterium]
MKFATTSFLAFIAVINLFAQTPIDTIINERGEQMIIYDDRSWQNIDEIPFDGVMNPKLQKYLATKNITQPQPWNTHTCFSMTEKYGLDANFKDTIALNLNVNSKFFIPVSGAVVSEYKHRGKRPHKGIDLGLRIGDSVVSVWDGKVRYAEYNRGGYGNLVVVRHSNGLETYYAHLSKLKVKVNDEVKAGDLIGLGGSTGHSTGPHLHFEVRFYDMTINPEEIIDFTTKALKKDTLLICSRTLRPNATPTDRDIHHHHDNIDGNHDELHENTQYVTAVAVPTTATKAPSTAAKSYYKVKSGDTLSKIAARNNTTIAKLCQLNGLRQNSILQVGRTLRIR